MTPWAMGPVGYEACGLRPCGLWGLWATGPADYGPAGYGACGLRGLRATGTVGYEACGTSMLQGPLDYISIFFFSGPHADFRLPSNLAEIRENSAIVGS